MKKRALSLVLALVMALSMAACGNSASSGTDENQDAAQTSSQAEDSSQASETESEESTAEEETAEEGAVSEGEPEIFPALYEESASMAGFEPGETVTVRDLLYGIILPSGGECSVEIARHVSGSEEAFVEKMNEKAAELGMTDTHFANVTGLQDEEHYTTVKDMSILLQNALENRLFRQIFCTREYTASSTEQHPQGLSFESSMFRLEEDWQVKGGEIRGGKTGFTDQAGLCLASLAHVDNRDYILVTAKADGNHQTEPYHALDALNLYGQIRKELPASLKITIEKGADE